MADERFIADNTEDGTAIVLDMAVYGRHSRARVVVACHNDPQAEYIAGFLNGELGWGTPASAAASSKTEKT